MKIAFIYQKSNQPGLAIDYLNKSYKIYKAIYLRNDNQANASNIVISLNNIGICYRDMGYREKSIDIINKALQFYQKVFEQTKNNQLPNVYHNFGMLLLNLKNYNKSDKYFEQVSEMVKSAKLNVDKELPFV